MKYLFEKKRRAIFSTFPYVCMRLKDPNLIPIARMLKPLLIFLTSQIIIDFKYQL